MNSDMCLLMPKKSEFSTFLLNTRMFFKVAHII